MNKQNLEYKLVEQTTPIQITDFAYKKANCIANRMCKLAKQELEVGFFLLGEHPNEECSNLVIDDIYIGHEQQVTGIVCDITAVGTSRSYRDIRDNIDKRILGWGHSHAYMSTFYSDTDDSTILDIVNKWGMRKDQLNTIEFINSAEEYVTPYNHNGEKGLEVKLGEKKIYIRLGAFEDHTDEYIQRLIEVTSEVAIKVPFFYGMTFNAKGDDPYCVLAYALNGKADQIPKVKYKIVTDTTGKKVDIEEIDEQLYERVVNLRKLKPKSHSKPAAPTKSTTTVTPSKSVTPEKTATYSSTDKTTEVSNDKPSDLEKTVLKEQKPSIEAKQPSKSENYSAQTEETKEPEYNNTLASEDEEEQKKTVRDISAETVAQGLKPNPEEEVGLSFEEDDPDELSDTDIVDEIEIIDEEPEENLEHKIKFQEPGQKSLPNVPSKAKQQLANNYDKKEVTYGEAKYTYFKEQNQKLLTLISNPDCDIKKEIEILYTILNTVTGMESEFEKNCKQGLKLNSKDIAVNTNAIKAVLMENESRYENHFIALDKEYKNTFTLMHPFHKDRLYCLLEGYTELFKLIENGRVKKVPQKVDVSA